METLESKAPAQPGLSEMQEQFRAMRHLIVSVMILLGVVSGTFNLYLWKRWRDVGRELEAIRPQAPHIAAEVARLQKTEIPAMQDFLKKITDFGRTHPDFAPILAKYNIKATATTSATPTTGIIQPVPPLKTIPPAKK